MVSRMRRRWGRFRSGSEPEIAVNDGKKKLWKPSDNLRRLPANQKSNNLNRNQDSQDKSRRRSEKTKKLVPPLRPSLSVEKVVLEKEDTAPKPKKKVTIANDGRPVPMPILKKRAPKSDASVTSSRSVQKMLGMRPQKPPLKKVSAPRQYFDERTYLTFNTLPERRLYQQQLAEKQRAARFDFLKPENIMNKSAEIGKCIVEDTQNMCNAISSSFQNGMAAIAGAMTAACAACTACVVCTSNDDSSTSEINTKDTMDEYLAEYEAKYNDTATDPHVSVLSISQASHNSSSKRSDVLSQNSSSKRSDAFETTKTPPTSNTSHYPSQPSLNSNHLRQPSVLNEKPESKASSHGSKTYDWENLDDESLVSRPRILHPNQMRIGRKLIDYDDLTQAYHEAHADLEDPGCNSEMWSRCFQWDEFEMDDDLTLDTYRSGLDTYRTGLSYRTEHTPLPPKPEPKPYFREYRHYNLDSPSTIQEVDETIASFDNTYQGMYDARDEPSLADEGKVVHWR